MTDIFDHIGERYGKLVIIDFDCQRISKGGSRSYMYTCKCDCGEEKSMDIHSLRRGRSKSCGCGHFKTHGGSHTDRLYNIWQGIRSRCSNKNGHNYNRYGGRGIKVCKEWDNDYVSFRDWSLQNGYVEDIGLKGKNKITIDRIDNDGDYEPSNCRWVSLKVQERNKTGIYSIEINGEKRCLMEWSEMFGIKYKTVMNRIHYGKMSPIDALTTPVHKRNRH